MADDSKPGRGRRPIYQDDFPDQARKLCEQFGAIDQDLANYFGVSIRSIHKWKAKYPDFRAALVLGKEVADDNVERALYMRAMGYSCPETKVFHTGEKIVSREITRHYPPDVKAIMHWLSNRRRGAWSFRPDANPGGGYDETPEGVEVEVIDGRVGNGESDA